MPIYEYQCKKCGHTFDHLARTLSDTAKACPKCGARNPEKLISAFSTTEGSHDSGSCSTGICPTWPTGTCSLE
jgi:putative FmdB family regulatory protein